MISLILMFMVNMAMMFMFLNHPLSMGLILLIQTVLTALFTGLMNYNFWFSYILFLIMIGGMLVLFIYMTSIASNEKFKFSSNLLILFLLSTLMTSLIIIDQYFYSYIMSMSDINSLNKEINNYMSLNKYFNYPNNIILYMMIIYLLISLIMVVKITNINYGPMRQMY